MTALYIVSRTVFVSYCHDMVVSLEFNISVVRVFVYFAPDGVYKRCLAKRALKCGVSPPRCCSIAMIILISRFGCLVDHTADTNSFRPFFLIQFGFAHAAG